MAGRPQTLGYSIEQNLKHTTDWILGLGLSKAQLAKVVAGHPQILGCVLLGDAGRVRQTKTTHIVWSPSGKIQGSCGRKEASVKPVSHFEQVGHSNDCGFGGISGIPRKTEWFIDP